MGTRRTHGEKHNQVKKALPLPAVKQWLAFLCMLPLKLEA